MPASVRKLIAGAIAFLAAIVLLWILVGPGPIDGDDTAIERERVKRRAIYAARGQLAGTPVLASLDTRLADNALAAGSPIFIRVFKREFELEVWLKRNGRFELFETYPVCRFSGTLGPKQVEGDRQSPEGFYTVDARALNPQSRWHKSFNVGYPNAFDRQHGRTGSFLMVHGGCSSVGCFAMTNDVIDEIWRLVTAALKGGQPRFQVQMFPFRMSEENLASRVTSPHVEFWSDLKAGHDDFLSTGLPPRIAVCNGRYVSQPAASGDGSGEITAGCFDANPATDRRARQLRAGRRQI